MLKECAKQLAPGLSTIFQTSFDKGELPADWANANVSPVFEKGDVRVHLAENYRPVSLTFKPLSNVLLTVPKVDTIFPISIYKWGLFANAQGQLTP